MIRCLLPLILCFVLGCSDAPKPEESSGTENTASAESPSADTAQAAESKDTAPSSDTPTEAPAQSESGSETFGFESMEYKELTSQPLAQFIEKKEYPKAAALLKRLMEEDSEPIEYHFRFAQVYFATEDYGKAMDEIDYVIKAESSLPAKKFSKEAQDLRDKATVVAEELILKLGKEEDEAKKALLCYHICKIDRDKKLDFVAVGKAKGAELRKRDYYIVKGMGYFQTKSNQEKSFWNFYYAGYFNYVKGWNSDARKFFDKALSVADTQDQVFFALQVQEKIPKKEESELDKLSSLDLSEDMIDEFLNKHSKELNPEQMAKVREVIKEGMKLKEKIDKSDSDRNKLDVLREFMKLAETKIDRKDFPPDVVAKVDKMKEKAQLRFKELEEQIKVKEEALK